MKSSEWIKQELEKNKDSMVQVKVCTYGQCTVYAHSMRSKCIPHKVKVHGPAGNIIHTDSGNMHGL